MAGYVKGKKTKKKSSVEAAKKAVKKGKVGKGMKKTQSAIEKRKKMLESI